MLMKQTDKFYLSNRWKTKRSRILRRDNYLCQLSRRYGKMRPADTVHHIFPREDFPEYALADWNLISVCGAEHDRLHDRGSGKLTAYGMELLRRTARRNRIEIPDMYR